MNSQAFAPILLFVYNRLFHTQRLIESLRGNIEASKSDLFIYADAPANGERNQSVQDVRNYIHSLNGFRQINIIERTQHFGLANNVIDAVSSVLTYFDRVIVLEDDLIVSPYFLQFMNDALETYKNEPKVGHIQACEYTQNPKLPETFLIKFPGSWGWGTWSRAWKYFNPNGAELLKKIQDRHLSYAFDFNGSYKYTRMLRRQIEGKNDSWAIRWNASLFLSDILSLNAGRSLVQNKGFDGTGTNCGAGGDFSSQLYTKPLPVIKIDPITENNEAREYMRQYYHSNYSFWARVKRRIKRTLKGDWRA